MNTLNIRPSQPILFLDPAFFSKMEGSVALAEHKPVEREIAITHDRPWEGPTSTFHTVFRDGDRYRMYYRGSTRKGSDEFPKHQEYTCYAESTDGVHWTKPDLGLFEFDESTHNNIVLASLPATHNFAPFLDTNPDCPPASRYKAVAKFRRQDWNTFGLQAFHSADGLRWELIQQEPIIIDGHFDSLNKVFWDTIEQRYRCYYRDFQFHRGNFSADGTPDGLRAIRTASSKDFLNWTRGEFITFDNTDSPQPQLYTNAISPYARNPCYYVGLPMRYSENPDPTGAIGLCDSIFMASTNGFHFHRRDEAIVRPSQNKQRWYNRNNLPADGIIETQIAGSDGLHELSMFTTENYQNPTGGSTLRRHAFRLDGFVSLQARLCGGSASSCNLLLPDIEGQWSLALNASTSACGSIRVGLLKHDGGKIDGFGIADCMPIHNDGVNLAVQWRNGVTLPCQGGDSLRLVFELADADLFSFTFNCNPQD